MPRQKNRLRLAVCRRCWKLTDCYRVGVRIDGHEAYQYDSIPPLQPELVAEIRQARRNDTRTAVKRMYSNVQGLLLRRVLERKIETICSSCLREPYTAEYLEDARSAIVDPNCYMGHFVQSGRAPQYDHVGMGKQLDEAMAKKGVRGNQWTEQHHGEAQYQLDKKKAERATRG